MKCPLLIPIIVGVVFLSLYLYFGVQSSICVSFFIHANMDNVISLDGYGTWSFMFEYFLLFFGQGDAFDITLLCNIAIPYVHHHSNREYRPLVQ